MKIKGLIITGSIILVGGIALTSYAATRDDFDYKEYLVSDVTVEETTYALDTYEIDNIIFDADADYIKVIPTDEETVKVKSKNCEAFSYDIIYEAEDKSLVIKQKCDDMWFFKSFNLKFLSFFRNGSELPFVIEIPRTLVASLNVSISAGMCEINDIEFTDLIASVDCGAIETTNINAAQVTMSTDCGSIVYKGKVTTSGVYKVDLGSIWLELDGKDSDYNVNSNHTGAVSIITDTSCGTKHIEYNEK